jgi:hypothetical protein
MFSFPICENKGRCFSPSAQKCVIKNFTHLKEKEQKSNVNANILQNSRRNIGRSFKLRTITIKQQFFYKSIPWITSHSFIINCSQIFKISSSSALASAAASLASAYALPQSQPVRWKLVNKG